MDRRLLPVLAVLLLAPLPALADPGDDTEVEGIEPEQEPDIIGGTQAQTCQWPTTVLMQAGGGLCTGTLVDPEIVLYAAHCPTVTQVQFTETAFGGGGRSVPVDFCQKYGSGQQVGPDDYAFCKLASPVTDVPITPVVYGCETDILQAGQPAVIAGFGQTNANDGQSAGSKYYGETTINQVINSGGFSGMVAVGGGGTGAWQGDSGGPAYVRYPNDGSWHAFGIVSGGNPQDVGGPVYYVRMDQIVPWVEQSSGVDITPCFDQDGTWNPNPECGEFATTPDATGNSWNGGCAESDALSAPSTTCGEPWNSEPDDVPPTVAIVTPTNGTTYAEDPAVIDIQIDADDEGLGVRRVWLEINGEDQSAEDNMAPYIFFGAEFPAGGYVLRAKAEDWGGNVTVSDGVGIGVGGEPAPEPPPSGDGDGDGDGGGDAGDDGGGDAGDDAGGDGGTGDEGGDAGFGDSEGSGGCSITGGPTPLGSALVVLGVIGLLRRRRD